MFPYIRKPFVRLPLKLLHRTAWINVAADEYNNYGNTNGGRGGGGGGGDKDNGSDTHKAIN